MNIFFEVTLTLLILYGIKSTKTEIFTSLAEVEELFEIESALVNDLEEYLLSEENKLEYLKYQVSEFKRKHQPGYADVTAYVSNPINAYLLIKRLTSDWTQLENLIAQDDGIILLDNITHYRNSLKLPSDKELSRAAEILVKLQDTYKLKIANLDRTELNINQYSSEMTIDDCLDLALTSYVIGDCHNSVLWIDIVLNRFVSEPETETNETVFELLTELRELIPDDKNCISENK